MRRTAAPGAARRRRWAPQMAGRRWIEAPPCRARPSAAARWQLQAPAPPSVQRADTPKRYATRHSEASKVTHAVAVPLGSCPGVPCDQECRKYADGARPEPQGELPNEALALRAEGFVWWARFRGRPTEDASLESARAAAADLSRVCPQATQPDARAASSQARRRASYTPVLQDSTMFLIMTLAVARNSLRRGTVPRRGWHRLGEAALAASGALAAVRAPGRCSSETMLRSCCSSHVLSSSAPWPSRGKWLLLRPREACWVHEGRARRMRSEMPDRDPLCAAPRRRK